MRRTSLATMEQLCCLLRFLRGHVDGPPPGPFSKRLARRIRFLQVAHVQDLVPRSCSLAGRPEWCPYRVPVKRCPVVGRLVATSAAAFALAWGSRLAVFLCPPVGGSASVSEAAFLYVVGSLNFARGTTCVMEAVAGPRRLSLGDTKRAK